MRPSELTPEQRSALAARLRKRRRSTPEPQGALTETLGTASEVSLTHAQRPLYVAAQTRPGNPSFLVPLVIDLDGVIDTERLRAAVQQLTHAHEATSIRFHDGDPPRQSVDRTLEVSFLERRVRAADLDEVTRSVCRSGFDLSSPPHSRATLLSTDAHRHRLIVVWHHLLTDGWSLERWIDDLPAAYSNTFPPSSAPDDLAYARWEASPAGAEVLRRNADHWAIKLERLQDLPSLPLAPVTASTAGPRDVTVPVNAADDDRLRRLARRVGVTPTAAYLALLAAVWHVCADARQIPVGVPAGNRDTGVADDVPGLRSELLPLVVQVNPTSSFTDVLRAARSELIDAMGHEPVPLGDPRVAQRLPDITAVVVLTTSTPLSFALGAATATVVPVQVEGSQTPLSFLIDDGGEVPLWRLLRDTHAAVDLDALAGAFSHVLAAVLTDPQAPLGAMLPPATASRANSAGLFGPVAERPPLAPERLVRVVRATPQAPAVGDELGNWLDYGSFDLKVEVLARRLCAAGLRPGDQVAVALGRCADHLVAVHAVWRAAGCVVPMRLDDPPERLAMLGREAGVRLVVSWTSVDGLTGLPWLAPSNHDLGDHHAGGDGVTLPPAAASYSAAYIVFTSGTSGPPKPVVVSHESLANELQWRIDAIGLTASDRVLETIPLSFDPAFWQCFGPLAVGASVAILATDLGATPSHLVKACVDLAVTVVDVVPSLLAALTDADLAALPARVVFCGGEALPSSEAARYLSAGRGVLINMYGPSEAAIDATSYTCRTDNLGTGAVPLGLPIAGVSLYIVDSGLRPVFPGQIGELIIGGRGVSWGYLGRPRATAAAFLPDPFDSRPGARMYRTGDRVRMQPDGVLEFHGRIDHQIKVRGHRVEPEEIDAAVRAVTGSPRVATVLTAGAAGRLVAFAERPCTPTGRDLIAALSERLPRYMVPSEVVVVGALPLTRHGKVDRSALMLSAGRADSPPTGGDDLVAAVRTAFRHVLDVDTVSDDHDLYAAGGASLGAARVAALLRKTTGRRVSLETVLANPSVRMLSRALHAIAVDAAAETGPQVNTSASLWVRDLERAIGAAAPPVCHLVVLGTETGREDVARAVAAIVERHIALQGAAADGARHELCAVDALPEPPTTILEDPKWCEQGIDDDAPGMQAVLLGSRNRGRHVLVRLARSRADGASAVIVANELRALIAGRTPSAPPPSWPPRHRVSTPGDEAHIRSLEPLRHDPWALGRPARRTFRNHAVRVPLNQTLVAALATSCRQERVLPASTYLAATARAVLARLPADGLLLGLPVHGRDTPELQATVGRLVDLLPVPVHRGDGPVDVQRALMVSIKHAASGIRWVAGMIDPSADLRHRPAVCGIGVFMDLEGDAAEQPAGPIPDHWSDLDLVVHVAQRSLVVSGNSDLMNVASLQQLSDDVLTALSS